MGFAVHVASGKAEKGKTAPEKVLHGGAGELEDAKKLAQDAVAKKVRGPNTVAYISDDQTEDVVATVG